MKLTEEKSPPPPQLLEKYIVKFGVSMVAFFIFYYAHSYFV